MKNIEKYYIYGETNNGTEINDKSSYWKKKISDIVIKYEIP
jgi:hypothetical protein